jgi:hypothetical protein
VTSDDPEVVLSTRQKTGLREAAREHLRIFSGEDKEVQAEMLALWVIALLENRTKVLHTLNACGVPKELGT